MMSHLARLTGKYDQKIWMISLKNNIDERSESIDVRSTSRTVKDYQANPDTVHVEYCLRQID